MRAPLNKRQTCAVIHGCFLIFSVAEPVFFKKSVQTKHGDFHFSFILPGWIIHLWQSKPSQRVRGIQSVPKAASLCRNIPHEVLAWRPIHWPSACPRRQRSGRSSPSPAGWDARTPCPSGSVLWRVSAEATQLWLKVNGYKMRQQSRIVC